MKTLVLCVDRDNDLWEKAGIKGPVIGRQNTLRAATALALKDPEDADINSMFSSVAIHDELIRKEHETEVATICGDKNIGIESDRILIKQLDEVIKKVKPDEIVLVSDGTEDAHIFPIISSRVRVSSVKRVLVKQSQTAESTYYVIARALQEKRLLTPLAAVLLILGLVGVLGLFYPGIFVAGLALTLVVIGLYILNYTYRIDETLSRAWKELKISVAEAKISLPFMIVAFIILAIGIYFGLDYVQTKDVTLREKALLFGDRILLWVLIAAWVYIAGNVLDVYLRRGRVQYSFYVITISLLALGFIIYAAIDTLKLFISTPEDVWALQWTIYICIISGLVIAVIAAILNMYVKLHIEREARWRH